MFITLSTYLTMHVYSSKSNLSLEVHYMMLLNKMCYVDNDELGWDPRQLDRDVN